VEEAFSEVRIGPGLCAVFLCKNQELRALVYIRNIPLSGMTTPTAVLGPLERVNAPYLPKCLVNLCG
jgi:hypothetical protein